MDERIVTQPAPRALAKKKRRVSRLKALWIRIRRPLAQSRFTMGLLATLMVRWLRFVSLTNPVAEGSMTIAGKYGDLEPGILALWHGQHLLAPAIYPSKRSLVAMVSRSADAEINARVLEKFGVEPVRGSGGRNDRRKSPSDKGGARALIGLRKALKAGKNVCMIADIPHGKPRDAGMGVIVLARLSGRPIFPSAATTSRRKVLDRTWDKTTINLPFGRCAIVCGAPIFVPVDADDAEMERKRRELTDVLNAVTRDAYALADGAR